MAEPWEKYLRFRCTGCGNCCRDTVVCINDEDIRRIVDGTGKPPKEFVRFYTHDEIAMSHRDPLWLRFDKGDAVMGLGKIADRCVFLDNKSNLCKIYEYRPVTCRDHPVNVAFSDTGAVVKMWLSRIVKCPHAWDGNISKRELRRVQTLNQRHETAYLEKVRAWNQRKDGPRTASGFLHFLGISAQSSMAGRAPSVIRSSAPKNRSLTALR